MNISLGENLVWWLIAGDNNWWKQVLHKKYVNWVRESYTHHIPHNRGNSQLWYVILDSIPLNRSKMTWILGNGKSTHFWTDGIMGNPPLGSNLIPLCNWIIYQHKISFQDISSWSFDGNWLNWAQGNIPSHLVSISRSLESSLIGCAPSCQIENLEGGHVICILLKGVINIFYSLILGFHILGFFHLFGAQTTSQNFYFLLDIS